MFWDYIYIYISLHKPQRRFRNYPLSILEVWKLQQFLNSPLRHNFWTYPLFWQFSSWLWCLLAALEQGFLGLQCWAYSSTNKLCQGLLSLACHARRDKSSGTDLLSLLKGNLPSAAAAPRSESGFGFHSCSCQIRHSSVWLVDVLSQKKYQHGWAHLISFFLHTLLRTDTLDVFPANTSGEQELHSGSERFKISSLSQFVNHLHELCSHFLWGFVW